MPKPPLSLSISPDGLHAAVGHDSLISYVNLSSASVERTFPVPVTAQNITLSSTWLYVMPAYLAGSVSVNIASGAVTANSSVFYGTGGRFNASVNSIYGTRDGTSPNDIERYEISTGPITAQTDSIYHGDYPVCGPVFFSPSGQRIYDGCSTVFWASTDPNLDMRYVTTLAGAASVRSLTESAGIKRVAVIQGPAIYPATGTNDDVVLLYESDHLSPVARFTLPDVQAGTNGFKAHGQFIFFNASSTALFAVVQADASSGLLNNYAVETISLGNPLPCGATFASPNASVIASGSIGTANIVASRPCQYQASSDSPWLQIVAGGYGAGNGTLTYIARPNDYPVQRTGTISIAGISLAITQEAAKPRGTFTRIPYNAVDAAYDKALDKLITVSSNPNELHIYDPVNSSDQIVPLVMPPLSVSVRPDGLFAAVGHDGWVSYVNLQSQAVVQVYRVITDVHALLLASNGYIYLFPARDWSDIFSLQIATGLVTPTSAIYDGRVPRLSIDGKSMYLGGNWFSKWDISGGVARLSQPQTFNGVNNCGNLWLTEDGARLLTACAKAYLTSTVPSQDLQYNGQFDSLNSLVWADESTVQHSTAVIPGPNELPKDTQVQIYGDAFLGYVGSLQLPAFIDGGKSSVGHGKFVFWNASETKLFVLEKADASGNLASPYGIFVIEPSNGSGCTVSTQYPISNIPFSGGFDAVNVLTGAACIWTATTSAPWVTIAAGSFGVGAGAVSISAAANNTGSPRMATLTIGGTPVTVTQAAGACTFSFTPANATIGAQGTTGRFDVTTQPGCGWMATGGTSWLIPSSMSYGIGNGSATYVAGPNSNAATRNGAIAVGGQNFNVVELGSGCTFALNAGGQTFTSAAGSGSFQITVPAGCPWSAISNSTWLSTTGTSAAGGISSVSFQLAQNPGAARTGAISVGGLDFVVEQAAAFIPGLTPVGSMAQVASQSTWKFTLDAVNLGASEAQARFTFIGDNGSPLQMPLTFPQLPLTAGPLLGSTLDRAISSNAQVIIESTGPDSAPQLTGWGQLSTNGKIGGFGTFSSAALGWNAVVPLETRNAGKYVLAFDNTGALATGVAVANVAATAADIAVIIRDDTGAQIFAGTISLGAQGHKSFMLNDAQSGFPITNGRRGTIEFDTPQGGQISVLGLRANGPALTTLPVLANSDAPGGAIAHVTYKGGFTSVLYLVNTGTASAAFTLSFFDEAGGPLTVPLSLPQSAATTTTSALTQTLAAGAMLVVETQANNASAGIVGSAQLTTGDDISGFEIFRWTTFGQEASVPLETRTPGSFVLVFDDTNGLTTGVALSNIAGSAANVTGKIYDDTGALLQTASVALAPRGHTSFVLPGSYPLTANKRGMVEFVVPSGGNISAVGLRAKADGTLTTIPVLVK